MALIDKRALLHGALGACSRVVNCRYINAISLPTWKTCCQLLIMHLGDLPGVSRDVQHFLTPIS